MDTSVFTYVIDYNCAENAQTLANNCMIKLRGLPNNKRFYCEVVNFMINTESLDVGIPSYLTVTADSFCDTGYMTNSRFDIMCQFKTSEGGLKMAGNVFEVDNFNGKSINFQILDPSGSSIADNLFDALGHITTWQLTLRMKPIHH